MDAERRDRFFKIIVVGDIGTGKTSLIKRYVHDIFSSSYKSTVGVDFALKCLKHDNYEIRLQLWDIAGQERFGQMTRVYYKDAVGCLILFDVSHPSSFAAVTKWKRDVEDKVFLPDGRPIPCVLCANKIDLQNQVYRSPKEMDAFCREKGFLKWFETSAKTKAKVDDAVLSLLDIVIQNDDEMEVDASQQKQKNVVHLNQPNKQQQQQQQSRNGCCD